MNRIILDTETAGNVNCRKTLRVYDLGYQIVDSDFNVLATRSFVVRDTFFNKELMNTAYYAEKVPAYWGDIKAGTRKIKAASTVYNQFHEDCKEYGIKQVWAYNAAFDRSALDTMTRVYSNQFIKSFLPKGVQWCDIWACATDIICNKRPYFDFCLANGYVSESRNVKTSAEIVYQFLTNNPAFVESHTALEDVKIETAILQACLRAKKKMNKDIRANPWQTPQKKFRAYAATLE